MFYVVVKVRCQGISSLWHVVVNDEGGNFIDVRYGPLTPAGDYHIGGGPAVDAANDNMLNFFNRLATDIDAEPRPAFNIDIGADEIL